MTDNGLSSTHWRKSSRSNNYGGACVEIAVTPTVVGVRDSKDRDGGTLVLSHDQWQTFLASLTRR
ncbi:DUF397 domain-containing protein [Saccharopolyspora shandongensis]|uniref:DUF397 domain-containing protein n=1 Tax=Saccharopolyspora shandongensis TaxID=418495 RepID=UPI0033C5E803